MYRTPLPRRWLAATTQRGFCPCPDTRRVLSQKERELLVQRLWPALPITRFAKVVVMGPFVVGGLRNMGLDAFPPAAFRSGTCRRALGGCPTRLPLKPMNNRAVRHQKTYTETQCTASPNSGKAFLQLKRVRWPGLSPPVEGEDRRTPPPPATDPAQGAMVAASGGGGPADRRGGKERSLAFHSPPCRLWNQTAAMGPL